MGRYKRAELIAWLIAEGCEFDLVIPNGLIFFDRSGTQFTIPDPTNDGWLEVSLVEDVISNRWIGVGPTRPQRYP